MPARFLTFTLTAVLAALSARAEEGAEKTRNLIPWDSSFETGTGPFSNLYNYDRCKDFIGDIALDPQKSADGKQSLKITTSSNPNGKYDGVWPLESRTGILGTPVELEPGKTYTISAFASADKEGVSANLALTNPAWRHSEVKKCEIGKDWKRFSLTIKAKEKYYWPSFSVGGQGNTVRVDAIQLEEGDGASDYQNAAPVVTGIDIPIDFNQTFLTGETVPIRLSAWRSGKEPDNDSATLSYRISDLFGKTITEKTLRISFDKDGKFAAPRDFAPGQKGFFIVRSKVEQNGKIIHQAENTFAAVAPPAEISEGLTPFAGLNSQLFPAAKRIGARWADVGFNPHQLSSKKGEINWDFIDKWQNPAGLKKDGYLIHGHLRGVPSWISEDPNPKSRSGFPRDEESYEEYLKIIRAIAVRYKDTVDIWEIGGEMDLDLQSSFNRGKYSREQLAAKYGEMAKRMAAGIRAVIPGAKIGVVRPSGVDCENNFVFTREVLKVFGKDFDYLPIDPYLGMRYFAPGVPCPPAPERLLPVFDQAAALCRELGNGQSVYNAEKGIRLCTAEAPDSKYARQWTAAVAKDMLISRIKGAPMGSWFASVTSAEHDPGEYGLWRSDGRPTAGVAVYSAVAAVVENVLETKEVSLGPSAMAYVFRKPDGADATLWLPGIEEPDRRVGVEIPADQKGIKFSDCMGNPLPVKAEGEKISFELSELPVYLSLKEKDAFSNLVKTLSAAELKIDPVSMSFRSRDARKGIISLANQTSQPAEIALRAGCGDSNILSKSMKIPARATAEIDFKTPDAADQNLEISATADVKGCKKQIQAVWPLEFKRCPRVSAPSKQDGDISKWSGKPFIGMNERGQIFPLDPWIKWAGPESFSAKVYIGWDKQSLYITADVTDEVHVNELGPYNGDTFQFAIAPGDPAANPFTGYRTGDIEAALALHNGKPVLVQSYGPNITKKAAYSIKREDKKTVYEISVPLSEIGIKPDRGEIFGFNFVIFNTNDKGAAPNHWYQLTPGISPVKDPRLFKKFALE